MGLSSRDKYCARGDAALQDIDCVEKVVDDVLVHSRTPQENLKTVLNVLERGRKQGISFNPKKFEFLQSFMDYVGYRVSCDGVKGRPEENRSYTKLSSCYKYHGTPFIDGIGKSTGWIFKPIKQSSRARSQKMHFYGLLLTMQHLKKLNKCCVLLQF